MMNIQGIPEVVRWKVQDIVRERCEGDPTIDLTPWELYDSAFLSMHGSFAVGYRPATTWYYTQGKFWILISDGDPYIESITMTEGVDPAEGMKPNEVWIITLDDSCTRMRIYQTFLSCQH